MAFIKFPSLLTN